MNPDPTKRFTIKDIRGHQWYKQVEHEETNGIILGKDQIPVNKKILELLNKDYNINMEQCE